MTAKNWLVCFVLGEGSCKPYQPIRETHAKSRFKLPSFPRVSAHKISSHALYRAYHWKYVSNTALSLLRFTHEVFKDVQIGKIDSEDVK